MRLAPSVAVTGPEGIITNEKENDQYPKKQKITNIQKNDTVTGFLLVIGHCPFFGHCDLVIGYSALHGLSQDAPEGLFACPLA